MSRRRSADWQPLTEVDEWGAEHHGVVVETYRLGLASGLERKNLFLDTNLLASIGVTFQTDFVMLANLEDGRTSRPDYGVGSLEDEKPSIGSMVLGTRRVPLAEAYVSDSMFGVVNDQFSDPKALVIQVNTNEISHQIQMNSGQSLVDPRAWSGYLDSAIHASLNTLIPSPVHARTFRRLRRHGRFVTHRLLTPPHATR